jgi:hypothetical protein
MQKSGFLLLALPLWVTAQSPRPVINQDGIIRTDTNRPGLLHPGMVIAIYGHGFGPPAGCKGAALELCGVQVLLDDKPIEVQYAQEIQINARMPDEAPSQPVSRIMVISGGRRSDPVEVRRLPETAIIALQGAGRVNGPVWIHVELPHSLGVSYPSMAWPWDFACDEFEVRKDGKPLTPLPHPRLGMAYSGPSCPGTINLGNQPWQSQGRVSRLPLHLQYRFAEPGVYEVRLSHYDAFNRRPGEVRIQSAWTPIQVLAAIPRTVTTHPQEPAEILSGFLPDLLAFPDDEALAVLLEYLYHPSPRVRAYAANALYYWPDSVIEPRLMETLRANGPSAPAIDRVGSHASELVEAALPYLFSDDLVLFQGAMAAARNALAATATISPELRSRVEESLISAAGNLWRADAQTVNDLISLLGQIKNPRVRDVLWSLADHHTGTEQSLIAIAWQKDAQDLPRLAAYLTAAPADAQSGQALFGVPYAMRTQFGDAALPWLRTVLEKALPLTLRIQCAEELMRANDPSGFAFAQDAFGHNRPWKPQIRTMVNDQFPETRNNTDIQMNSFLLDRSQ